MKTVKRKLIYLVRTSVGVEVHNTKPSDVVFPLKDKKYWHVRTFRFRVGEADTRLLYSSNWLGTIGVYDISDPKHVQIMIKQFDQHLRQILFWNVKCELENNGVPMSERSKQHPWERPPTFLSSRLKDLIWPT
jgi:hypothetical protein